MVLGLGQFGMALSRALASTGVDLVVGDLREDRVALASGFATEALVIDATDEAALHRLAPSRRDLVAVAIGDEAREASIISTALLRQMGAARILARATDPLHERILRLVGAHEVVNPERSYGERLAARLVSRGVVDVLPLGADLTLTELRAPDALVGKNLAALDLQRRFELTVVAVRRSDGTMALPRADVEVAPGDELLVVGPPDAARKLLAKV
jgi:trk system potassium uptake protein TrkA